MKQVIASRVLTIPKGVDIEVKARRVRVKGPRGEVYPPVVLLVCESVQCCLVHREGDSLLPDFEVAPARA